MDEEKTTQVVTPVELPETSHTTEPPPKPAAPPEPSDALKMTKLGEDIGEAKISQAAESAEAANDHEPPARAGATTTVKFPFPLKMTQQTWLIVATVFMGLATLLIFGRAGGKNQPAVQVREERTIDSITPETLLAKCGTPAEDVSKDLYPMLKRTMSYKPGGKGTVTLEFSRTSEEKSAWVFLSMTDENGANFPTPDAQMAALPCLK
jgi:hypothetical protein